MGRYQDDTLLMRMLICLDKGMGLYSECKNEAVSRQMKPYFCFSNIILATMENRLQGQIYR